MPPEPPTCERHGVEKQRRMKGGVGKWECRECARDANKRSYEKSKAEPNELLNLDTAALLVGRDKQKFLVLCEELGIGTVRRALNDLYRMKDVQRIRAELKVRAAAWTRGERSRPW